VALRNTGEGRIEFAPKKKHVALIGTGKCGKENFSFTLIPRVQTTPERYRKTGQVEMILHIVEYSSLHRAEWYREMLVFSNWPLQEFILPLVAPRNRRG
jgi:hypothetical protein